LDVVICQYLRIEYKAGSLHEWQKNVVERTLHPKYQVKVAVVGKYIELQDAYKSIYEALRHGGIENDAEVVIKRINAEKLLNSNSANQLGDVSGVLVPGGFGFRGIEGKIKAIQYARESKVPFFGICLGMQCATIEFARNVLGWKGANSTEFNKKTPYPVISLLEEQEKVENLGGTMRLGALPCAVKKDTLSHKAYKADEVMERHRHRYEFNNRYREDFQKKGLRIAGLSPNGKLAEIVEVENHPWFLACQFHPEFKSKPDRAHPLFREFVRHALEYQKALNAAPQHVREGETKKATEPKVEILQEVG
jgi:CTP synthase